MTTPGAIAKRDAEAYQMLGCDAGAQLQVMGITPQTKETRPGIAVEHHTVEEALATCHDAEWARRLEELKRRYPKLIDRHGDALYEAVAHHNFEFDDRCKSELGTGMPIAGYAIDPQAIEKEKAQKVGI